MSKEILMVVDAVSREKGVSKEVIFEAMEAAMAMAAKKRSREDIESRVAIDRETGDYETFRCWEVIDDDAELEASSRQMKLEHARAIHPEIEVGQFAEQPIESVDGRIAVQIVKQFIIQKVREAERKRVVDAYSDKVGEMLSGVVKRIDRHNVFLNLDDNAEGLIPRELMIPKEIVRPGDRIRSYLKEVRPDTQGPQLLLSRTATELLIALFKLEVPEINEGMIDIISGARDPGERAKITVKANDPRIDPVGACVGMRGSRVQAVSTELAGERVDIILWDSNPAQFVINAMAPAEVASIVVDEDSHSMDIAVEKENLSQAIGRGGQNVRLASELTGWTLNVMSAEEADEKHEAEAQTLQAMFAEQLDIDEDMAMILVQEGYSSVEEIAYVQEAEMLGIEEFNDALVKELRSRAHDLILTHAISNEEKLMEAKPSEELLQMEGMDNTLAHELALIGVTTRNDLADLSVDELIHIEGLERAKAGELIMTARQPWFESEND